MVAQHAILFGTQARDRGTRRVVEPMRSKFHGDALELFEGVGEQQQFAFGVDGSALRPLRVPGMPDLEPTIGGIDIEIARRAHDVTRRIIDNYERHRPQTFAHVERRGHVFAHALRRRDRRVPQPPQLAIGCRLLQRRLVLAREWLQRGMLTYQRYGFDEWHETLSQRDTETRRKSSCRPPCLRRIFVEAFTRWRGNAAQRYRLAKDLSLRFF